MTVRNFTHEYLLSREEIARRFQALRSAGWNDPTLAKALGYSSYSDIRKIRLGLAGMSNGTRIKFSFVLKRIERGEIYYDRATKQVKYCKDGEMPPPAARTIAIDLRGVMGGLVHGTSQET